MEITQTVDFVPPEKPTCQCAQVNTISLDESADGAAVICEICQLPIVPSLDAIDEITDLIEEITVAPKPTYVPDKMIGQSLGEFIIQERIGSGGMARVYLAYDTILKRHVAVKLIQNKKHVSKESQAQLLKAEAISQASVQHPNVVSIFYVGTHGDVPYLAMEYVDGESLAAKIKSREFSFAEINLIASQIIDGLREAYGIGLVHGDIKPANLLTDDDGNVKLSDFGLARHMHDENYQPRRLVGTPSYMAPELFGNHAIDEQSDLYSLGVTLFQLTFGVSPYTLLGETVEEVRQSLEMSTVEFPAKWPEDLPLQWKKILTKLLEKSREDRYQSVAEVQQDVQSISSSVIPSKTAPKVCSQLIDNGFLVFLNIPFMTALVASMGSGDFWNYVAALPWLFGPLVFLGSFLFRRKTLGQSLTQTRAVNFRLETPEASRFGQFVFFQTLPAILLVMGICLRSFSGTLVMACLLQAALVVAILMAIHVFRNSGQSFAEKFCRLDLIVDT